VLFAPVVVSSCDWVEELDDLCGPSLTVHKVGQVDNGKLREASGLAKSSLYPAILWSHNDSENPPQIFALDTAGRVLRVFEVQGAENVDWEDIATDPEGNLYIADTGDNSRERSSVTVYRIHEPDPYSPRASAKVEGIYRLQYPGGKRFDAEAVYWRDGYIYLLNKTRSFLDATTVYRFRVSTATDEAATLEPVDSRNDLHVVTAADYSRPLGRMAFLSYTHLVLQEKGNAATRRFAVSLGQCEGICWFGEDLLVINEEGELFRIHLPR